ncbi:hypothetical protein Pcinc_041475 [Petrolisthes cinctipes]|uniref:Uncharacterized protein n=1 Tax=Petrolisthes cinctipes TaxID=88211 RepID=A0AAE1EGW5_PETCI|nr:hypothetical protein Pcinc_041475 [Petrolisthes cinctipes]
MVFCLVKLIAQTEEILVLLERILISVGVRSCHIVHAGGTPPQLSASYADAAASDLDSDFEMNNLTPSPPVPPPQEGMYGTITQETHTLTLAHLSDIR